MSRSKVEMSEPDVGMSKANVEWLTLDNQAYVNNFGGKVRLVSLHQSLIAKPGLAEISLNQTSEELGCSHLHGCPYGVGAVGLSVPRELY